MGMFGRITFLEDGVAHIEIDTDVVVRVQVSSISRCGERARAATAAGC